MIWFIIGLGLGVGIGINHQRNKVPNELEKCTTERSQQEIDLAYYKKLTQDLVKENKELRRKANDA
jgi:hypothetical protein